MPGGFSTLIFVIVIAISAISSIYRKAQEQKAKRNAQMEIKRREEERLRTGRDPDGPRDASMDPGRQATSAAEAAASAGDEQRQRELRERRQAQLRELREKLGGGSSTASPTSTVRPAPQSPTSRPVTSTQSSPSAPPGMREIELWPGGPRVLVPAGTSGPAPAPAPAPSRPKSAPRQANTTPPSATSTPPRTKPQQRPKTAPSQPQPQTSGREANVKAAAATVASQGETPRRTRERLAAEAAPEAIKPSWTPTNIDEWRRAFVAAEVLGRPVGERSASEHVI